MRLVKLTQGQAKRLIELHKEMACKMHYFPIAEGSYGYWYTPNFIVMISDVRCHVVYDETSSAYQKIVEEALEEPMSKILSKTEIQSKTYKELKYMQVASLMEIESLLRRVLERVPEKNI